jgi:hypothetical protein
MSIPWRQGTEIGSQPHCLLSHFPGQFPAATGPTSKGQLKNGKESKTTTPAARFCLALEANRLLVFHDASKRRCRTSTDLFRSSFENLSVLIEPFIAFHFLSRIGGTY